MESGFGDGSVLGFILHTVLILWGRVECPDLHMLRVRAECGRDFRYELAGAHSLAAKAR